MKKLLVVILLAFSATAFCNTYPPDPSGTFTGRLTVTKVLSEEGLSSRYSLKAQAKALESANPRITVSADGRTTVRTDESIITILTTVPESPAAAADVETSVTRITRVITVTTGSHGPAVTTTQGSLGPLVVSQPTRTVAYYVNGKPVEVSYNGSLLRITYRNPPVAVPGDPTAPQPNYTSFEFLLRKLSD